MASAAQYLKGQVLEREGGGLAKALPYYLQAAQQDYIPAIEALVECYSNNDSDKMITWLRRAAELGSAKSQYNLSLQLDGALEWLEKSANQGFAPAQCNLGVHYEEQEKNPARALELYLLAANQGHEVAMCNAADLYYSKHGNLIMARYWYSKASHHNALAQQWTDGIDTLLAMKCNTCQVELDTALQRCSGCRLARYCSTQCQQMDWSMHKSDCRNMSSYHST